MPTDYSFILAFYEIIKRYDYFEEEIRMGSFGSFKPNEVFIYVNNQDKSFFFDIEEKIVAGFERVSFYNFFRSLRRESILNYYLTTQYNSKLSEVVSKELGYKLNYEYYQQAKDAFNNFTGNGYIKLKDSHFNSGRIGNYQHKFISLAKQARECPIEKELNACIERAEALINRKINFDNL